MRRICVIGLGYIGLPTATMFALNGNMVYGYDVNPAVKETINQGLIHIEEPGLEELVRKAVQQGNLIVNDTPTESDVYIIAVPTPINDDKTANLDYVRDACRAIKDIVKKGDLVIVESTISPRTTEDIVVPLLERQDLKAGRDFYVAHCPERVLPGKIIEELINNNRVIGGICTRSSEMAEKVYRSFVKGQIYLTNATTAEMAKLMENTFRDVNIALANELVHIAKQIGVDALSVIELANKHPRVNIHSPGPGVGGHCLAVDPYFIVEAASAQSQIIAKARETNNSMPRFVVNEIRELLGSLEGKRIAVFGLTYKGNIDDMRESPAVEVVELLQEENSLLSIHDPHVTKFKLPLLTAEKALEGADLAVILVDHDEFRIYDWTSMGKSMNNSLIFDTRNWLKGKYEGVRVIKLGVYPMENADYGESEALVG